MSVVGEALAVCAERLGDDATGVLARLAGALGEDACQAARELASITQTHPGDRRVRRAEIAAAARAPVPLRVRAVHASWVEAALAELPPRARDALASQANSVDVWLARWATALFPPMPTTPRTDLERLVELDPSELAARINAIGTRALATQLADDPIARMQLTRRLPYAVGTVVEHALLAI